MTTRYRAAFTLVELLVVIAIIATLLGLLLPAVLSARERARIAQCANNQEQLGKAMISYELAKGHLPGYANYLRNRTTGARITVSWAPFMLPYIGRNDLWEGPTGNDGWRNGTVQASYVQLFVCPSDSPTVDCPLSYVVNVGPGQSQRRPPQASAPSPPWPPSDDSTYAQAYQTQVGLFRNFTLTMGRPPVPAPVRQISMTDVKSASRRPMIAESAFNILTLQNGTPVPTTRQWTDTNANATTPPTADRFGFLWPGTTPAVRVIARLDQSNRKVGGTLLPIHGGLVNVTFCDGHTEQLTDDPDTTCDKYDCTDLPHTP